MIKYLAFLFVVVVTPIDVVIGQRELSPVEELNVVIRQGALHGKQLTTTVAGQNLTTDAYLNIPYAKPPVGDLRWADPQPAQGWRGVRDATQYSAGCMQNLSSVYSTGPGCPATISEDCLYLNVFTPPNAATCDERGRRQSLPVMVWFHGGAFVTGAGGCDLYSGGPISNTTNQIVVTVNYRLQSLGFLVTPQITGNFGIKDQRLALAWVRANIESFGGDKNSITIVGESAGAMSVGIHLVSPASAGLFNKAIMQSNPITEYQTQSKALTVGTTFATAVGCDVGDAHCLRNVPLSTIMAHSPDDLTSWVPVIGNALLPDTPYNLFQQGRYSKVPIIMGNNQDEAGLFLYFYPGFGSSMNASTYESIVQAKFPTTYQQVLSLYPSQQNFDNRVNYGLILTHQQWSCPAARIMLAVSKYNPSNAGAYVYYLEHVASFAGSMFGPICAASVCHAQDLFFLFDTLENISHGYIKLTAPEESLAHSMQLYWGQFSATGVPSANGEPGWPRFEKHSNTSLVLNIPNSASRGHLQQFCNFWDKQV